MEFFNMRLKRKVDVPANQLRKQVFEKPGTKGGVQRRYALLADHEGTRMFKFVSEATFRATDVPEIETARSS